jgi:NAD(P)H-dependent FMN reductase
MVKILAFAGSARRGSLNKKLVKVAVDGAHKAGAEVTFIDLANFEIPLYDGDLEAAEGAPDDVKRIKALIAGHDGFLIASPEHNGAFTALLKNVLDWASRREKGEPSVYKGKASVIMATSPGALGGLRGLVMLRMLLCNLGVMVLPGQKAVPRGGSAFNEDGQLVDEKMRATIKALGATLHETLLRLNG